MQITRREALGASMGVLAAPLLAQTLRGQTLEADESIRLLVLGGTGFIGPYVVRNAIARGHSVSIFTRGRSEADLPNEVERLVGDRDGNLDALVGRQWDAVIDNTGYVPRIVRDSCELLLGNVDRYVFLSSRMAYADFLQPDKKEDAPRGVMDDPTNEDSRRFYGPLKALCEDVVDEVFGGSGAVVRSTGVAGPSDSSQRFTYWADRVSRGGVVLAPGDQTDPVQYIDVRDLAEFLVHLAESDYSGAFNAAGPASDLSVAEFLYGLRAITSEPVSFEWIPWEWLQAEGLRPRGELPMASPPKTPGDSRALVNNEKSIAHGLTFRPMAVTARDTLAAYNALPDSERTMNRRLDAERERALVEKWRASNG